MIERIFDPAPLSEQLAERVDPDQLSWLEDAAREVAVDAGAIRTRFPAVGRAVGRVPLDPDADPDDVHAWTVDDAARTLLLVELGSAAEAELGDLYRHGDAAERRGVLRALPYLSHGEGGMALVDDAIRTNDTRLIAAALGPYASEHLDEAAYNQAVLKCVFSGIPIAPLEGLPRRATPELARMLAAFAHERVAAGRDVPADVWDVIDRHPPEAELRAIEAELRSPYEDRRSAAERALQRRSLNPSPNTEAA